MKIGILGSGVVAQVLAGGFIKHGHEVTVGTRSPDKLKEWSAKYPSAHIAGFPEAAKFGELAVLAVKGSVALDALRLAGAANFAGKTVIDVTNPIADAPPVNGDGTSAARISEGAFRQGIQLGRQRFHGQPAIQGRQADHVHLRQ